jgi:hypothetical protein
LETYLNVPVELLKQRQQQVCTLLGLPDRT